jgi:hypothetical protein
LGARGRTRTRTERRRVPALTSRSSPPLASLLRRRCFCERRRSSFFAGEGRFVAGAAASSGDGAVAAIFWPARATSWR